MQRFCLEKDPHGQLCQVILGDHRQKFCKHHRDKCYGVRGNGNPCNNSARHKYLCRTCYNDFNNSEKVEHDKKVLKDKYRSLFHHRKLCKLTIKERRKEWRRVQGKAKVKAKGSNQTSSLKLHVSNNHAGTDDGSKLGPVDDDHDERLALGEDEGYALKLGTDDGSKLGPVDDDHDERLALGEDEGYALKLGTDDSSKLGPVDDDEKNGNINNDDNDNFDDDTDFDYRGLCARLTNALQDKKETIKILKRENKKLKSENEKIKRENVEMKTENENMREREIRRFADD